VGQFLSGDLGQLYLGANKVEQQGYKSCMVLLKQADKYSPQRLDAACKKALTFTPMPSLKSVQSILKSGLDKLLNPETTSPPPEIPKYGFTRGADYYRRDEQC
jgi:hypothetical protein